MWLHLRITWLLNSIVQAAHAPRPTEWGSLEVGPMHQYFFFFKNPLDVRPSLRTNAPKAFPMCFEQCWKGTDSLG